MAIVVPTVGLAVVEEVEMVEEVEEVEDLAEEAEEVMKTTDVTRTKSTMAIEDLAEVLGEERTALVALVGVALENMVVDQ
mmetsp:Transcript_3542/g.4725  ORF Transcript_3542/g.4725 Transcript_3542/m.4725 type:complete len:80 (-) Transcript_3542:137-376(-)